MLIVTRPYSLQILSNEGLICVSEQKLYAAQQSRAEQIRKRDEDKWRQADQHQRDGQITQEDGQITREDGQITQEDGQITQEQSESNARTLDNDQKNPATTFDN